MFWAVDVSTSDVLNYEIQTLDYRFGLHHSILVRMWTYTWVAGKMCLLSHTVPCTKFSSSQGFPSLQLCVLIPAWGSDSLQFTPHCVPYPVLQLWHLSPPTPRAQPPISSLSNLFSPALTWLPQHTWALPLAPPWLRLLSCLEVQWAPCLPFLIMSILSWATWQLDRVPK